MSTIKDFYYILDRLIKEEIDKKQKIAIYPFEELGLQAQDIVINRYGRECIIIDDYLAEYNQNIISFIEFEKIDTDDITIIICESDYYSNEKIIKSLLAKKLKAQIRNIIEPWNINISSGIFAKYGVIQRPACNVGLFSYFITILGGINLCLERNLLPVIDMYTCDNIFQKNNKKLNSWELFFEQPANINLEDINEEIQIIDCNEIPNEKRPNLTMNFITNEKALNYWRKLCKKYIKLNKKTNEYIIKCQNEYFSNNQESQTVGVLCRGTDYVNIKPYLHPVQPDVDKMIWKVRKVMSDYNCKYVFLATEDIEIYNRFTHEFTTALITPNVYRYSNTGKYYLEEIERKKSNTDIEKKGLDYLSSIYMLSKCKCLVAGRTSGSVSALILSEGFEYSYMWNLGTYGVDDIYE